MYYFHLSEEKSRRAFASPVSTHPGSLRSWQHWLTSQPQAPRGHNHTVADVVRRFIQKYLDEGRVETAAYYRKHLRRFAGVFGAFSVHDVDEEAVAAFGRDLGGLELGPKTISHDLKAVRTLWSWASSPYSGRLAPPRNLDLVKIPRVPKGRPEPLTRDELKRAVRDVAAAHPSLAPWVRLQYLAALRPSEVVRLAYGQGRLAPATSSLGKRPVPDGLIELAEHKMAEKVGHCRIIPLSAAALAQYRLLQPLPRLRRSSPRTRTPEQGLPIRDLQNRYARLCREAGWPGLPHRLRDSAASHLLERRVPQGDVDLILGHGPIGELLRYGRLDPQSLRASAARLRCP